MNHFSGPSRSRDMSIPSREVKIKKNTPLILFFYRGFFKCIGRSAMLKINQPWPNCPRKCMVCRQLVLLKPSKAVFGMSQMCVLSAMNQKWHIPYTWRIWWNICDIFYSYTLSSVTLGGQYKYRTSSLFDFCLLSPQCYMLSPPAFYMLKCSFCILHGHSS